MNFHGFTLAVAGLVAVTTVSVLPAQQSTLAIDHHDITFTGCIRKVDLQAAAPASILVWSRSDIMLAAVTALGAGVPSSIGTATMSGRVFYWLDEDDDLSNHVGQWVEVEGHLKDFETGEVEIDRDGDITEIKVEVGGRKQKARIPTAWLQGSGADHDREFEIATRRVKVDEVRVLGACTLP